MNTSRPEASIRLKTQEAEVSHGIGSCCASRPPPPPKPASLQDGGIALATSLECGLKPCSPLQPSCRMGNSGTSWLRLSWLPSPAPHGGYFGSEGVRSIIGPILEVVAETRAASAGFSPHVATGARNSCEAKDNLRITFGFTTISG